MTPFAYLKKTEKKRMKDLFDLLKYQSVSAKSEHKKDMVACANWLKDHLKGIGFKAKVYPTGGHPLVF
ncbi:MAG: peptidase M20, partial [candidate division Zixibacteria bacterium]|nr:peptidase M20 [candidate division Zixibacteria bacterium]